MIELNYLEYGIIVVLYLFAFSNGLAWGYLLALVRKDKYYGGDKDEQRKNR